MGLADERIRQVRLSRYASHALNEKDSSVKFFIVGWAGFLLFGGVFFTFSCLSALYVLRFHFGFTEDIALINSVITALIFGILGYFVGQLTFGIILFKLGTHWKRSLHFGKRPVLYSTIASWFTFNICFFLLATLIASF